MSDLISRSALYNKLVELETLARNRVLDTPINNPCYQRYVSQMNERTMLKELVADLSTAYNADKVVAELEEESDYEPIDYDYCDMSCSGEEHFIVTDKAIDIVRKGGME